MLDPNTTAFSIDHAAELARLAELAYLDAPESQARALGYASEIIWRADTQALVAHDAKNLILAFRGTEPGKLRDLCTDVRCCFTDAPGGPVHEGFRAALLEVLPALREAIGDLGKGRARWFLGHSLGASLAIQCAAELALTEDQPVWGVYAYAPARAGSREWGRAYDIALKNRTFSIFRELDGIPRLPPRRLGFTHVGEAKYLRDGELHRDPAPWLTLLTETFDPARLWDDRGALDDHQMARYRADLETLAQRKQAA